LEFIKVRSPNKVFARVVEVKSIFVGGVVKSFITSELELFN